MVGVVDTGLLRGRDPSAGDDGRRLVDLVAGEQVLVSTRPRSSLRSPERLVGVDCPLGPPGGRQVRGIGTVRQRALITDHEVVQGSAFVKVVPAPYSSRQSWSHYLARPGVIETVGRADAHELDAALAAARRAPSTLDLGTIAERVTDEVQSATRGGSREPFRAARVRLRWVARMTGEDDTLSEVRFDAVDDRLRVLRFIVPGGTPPGPVAAVCEDVALHDWLLTTLIANVRKAAIGLETRAETLRRLLPAIDHLLHVWMPAARADDLTERMWIALERHAGFTRQWNTLVNRIRDQLSVGVAEALSAATRT
ncbi:hypothetical protein C8E87_6311 [Paractinoplanes brasiliensis]|uniref:Uncharacterized protein n=1 Tax=Paractinoplanes brasiliensis TaxID=52695 RepID=A0A4V3C8U6_9ACTN|nr:hypothetical protein C8E87_6311 [Actinoplanes brasiliensis]